jgi:hypothetical protein
MVKHYCDFCGTEVHDLNSYEVEIIFNLGKKICH